MILLKMYGGGVVEDLAKLIATNGWAEDFGLEEIDDYDIERAKISLKRMKVE